MSDQWMMRGRVRVRADVTVGSPASDGGRTYRAGEELEMILRGRVGEPLADASWWSGADIDTAHILRADQVDVLELTGPFYTRCASCGAGGEIERGDEGIPQLVTYQQQCERRLARALAAKNAR